MKTSNGKTRSNRGIIKGLWNACSYLPNMILSNIVQNTNVNAYPMVAHKDVSKSLSFFNWHSIQWYRIHHDCLSNLCV
jgi:hypothetical protein